jgi:iron complex transport system substrate-binding protein
MKRKFISVILITLIVSSFTGCMNTDNKSATTTQSKETVKKADYQTITDMDGNVVKLPAKVNKIGTSWPGFINVLLTVGGGDKIVVSADSIKNYPWALKIFPKLKNINYPFSTSGVNQEQLLINKPDVLFLRKTDKSVDKNKVAGIPAIMIDYTKNSIYDMIDAVTLAGKVLGKEGVQRAAKYKEFVVQNINKITSVTKQIPDNQKQKVLTLSVSGKVLSTWGKNIIQNEEINMVGGINVAEKDINGYKDVSFEQILKWNPDVIFVDWNENDKAKLMKDPRFTQIKAVQSGKVFVIPQGIFKWSSLGSETALYLPWMAKTLYPEKFKDLDVTGEAKSFYKTFFNYNLSDSELNRILSAQKPE